MVAAALARHSKALVPRSGPRPDRALVSVLVTVVVAHPALGIVGILVAALGHHVEHVVGVPTGERLLTPGASPGIPETPPRIPPLPKGEGVRG